MKETQMQKELQNKINKSITPVLQEYDLDTGWIDSVLKWKPIVLVIGSYSSGKSTLINELLGLDIQRTGQAPTDDCFTVITNEGKDIPSEIPGSTLVNDPKYPFAELKNHGEKHISHLCLKNVDSALLQDMAIIDTPGMIDSAAEQDRGYNYMEVIGELAVMADLVVLMFDPHKAGTIQETFSAISKVLPERTGEDRVLYVLSRIDECENLKDLIRSYGTLCWNLSHMTGRKDIPHIYLTYAPDHAPKEEQNNKWPQERKELKDKLTNAQSMRTSHILEHADRKTGELELVCESMYNFSTQVRKLLGNSFLWMFILSLIPVLTGFWILNGKYPNYNNYLLPGALLFIILFTIFIGWFWFSRLRFPKLLTQRINSPETLIFIDTEYKKNLWTRIKPELQQVLRTKRLGKHIFGTRKNLKKVRHFINQDLKKLYTHTNKSSASVS